MVWFSFEFVFILKFCPDTLRSESGNRTKQPDQMISTKII